MTADKRALTGASERLLARLYPKVTGGRGYMLGFQWAEYDALCADLRAIEYEAALRGTAHDETATVWSAGTACGGCTGAHSIHNQHDCIRCTCEWQMGVKVGSSPEPVPSEPDAGSPDDYSPRAGRVRSVLAFAVGVTVGTVVTLQLIWWREFGR